MITEPPKFSESSPSFRQRLLKSCQAVLQDWLPAWPYWRVPVMLAISTGLLQLGGAQIINELRYDRVAIQAGQWWRLFTGNFVHLGGVHWLFNALSLVLLVLLCGEALSLRVWAVRIGVLAAGVGLGLYGWLPGLTTFVGLSGMIYGMFLIGLGKQAFAGDRLAWGAIGILLARVGWELVFGAPAEEEHMLGGAVVPMSHVFGMLAALLYVAGEWAGKWAVKRLKEV